MSGPEVWHFEETAVRGRSPMKKPTNKDRTATGVKTGARKRSSVMKDFEKVAGPLRGHNQDPKPKA